MRTLNTAVGFLIIAASLLLPHYSTSAAQVSSDTATAAVRAWLRADTRPLGEALGARIRQVETFKDDAGTILYYVVDLDPSGFVIVAADDLVEPIIAFSSQGHFDPSPANPLGALVSQDLPGRIHQAQRQALGVPGADGLKAREKWQQLAKLEPAGGVEKNKLSNVSDIRVAPLTQTTWSQATAGDYGVVACYNYYTPPYGDGNKNNYYCGCVATAMAQVMRFHQHPTMGVGTASFTIYVNNLPQSRSLRGGDGVGGPYNWSNMPLAPSSNPTVAQCQAIGALTADAGVAVGMKYQADGSSANTLEAKKAFVNTFHYSSAVQGWNYNADIGAGLVNMINPNLDARYPVLLAISGAGGHAVVGDGYGFDFGTLYHHLNLGWSGSDTAWYALPYVDTRLDTFTTVHGCVYNVYVSGAGEIISGRVVDDASMPLANATVTATRTGGGTYTATTDSKGIYALAKIPSGSQYSLTATKPGYSSATRVFSTGTSTDNKATSGNVWGADFSLSAGPTAVDHFAWSAIASPQGVATPFRVTITAQNTTNGPATSFDGTVSLSGTGTALVTNVILGNLTYDDYDYDTYSFTDGYAFTPNADLQVTHVRSYYGTKVSIWTDTGVRLASQTLSGASGTWREAALATPVALTAGTRYRVGVYYSAYTYYYCTFSWPATFSNGTIDPYYYYGSGDSFPNTLLDTGVGPLLDLRYTVLASTSIPLSPTTSGGFVNGVWSGDLTIPQTVTSLVVKADDGAGHTGLSNPFDVARVTTPTIGSPRHVADGQFQFTLAGAIGCNYQVLVSSDLKNWQPLCTLSMTNSTCDIRDATSSQQQRFYRAQWVP